MTNTKIDQYAVFTSQTSYFNYKEFIKVLIDSTINKEKAIEKSITWKWREYNKIISSELERQLQLLMRSWHISISNSDQSVQKEKTIDRNLCIKD